MQASTTLACSNTILVLYPQILNRARNFNREKSEANSVYNYREVNLGSIFHHGKKKVLVLANGTHR